MQRTAYSISKTGMAVMAVMAGGHLVAVNEERIEKYGLMDPDFKYVPSEKTDIRKTFARFKKQSQLELIAN